MYYRTTVTTERETDGQKEGIHTKIANSNASTRRHFDRHLSTSSKIYAVEPKTITTATATTTAAATARDRGVGGQGVTCPPIFLKL